MSERLQSTPPPLTVAASLVAVQGLALLGLALVELANVDSERVALGVAVSVFFLIYAVALLLSAWALSRRQGWARGPVLLTQLIQLGLAWNLRETPGVALGLAAGAAVVIAGMLHPTSIAALADDPTADDPARD